jgi:hypothetical protein
MMKIHQIGYKINRDGHITNTFVGDDLLVICDGKTGGISDDHIANFP